MVYEVIIGYSDTYYVELLRAKDMADAYLSAQESARDFTEETGFEATVLSVRK